MTKALVLGAAILAGLVVSAAAQETQKPVDLAAEYQSLINAERAFAKKSMETNAKEAFLAFIADDGVLFNPDPVSGKEAWQKRPAPDYTLDWWPTYSDISRSADLGWNTGPYVITLKDGKHLYGYFSTVWRKQADGTWRFVTDIGASMPDEPKRGREAAALRLSEEKGAFSSKPIGGGSAKAGDLGYVYGSYERKGEKPESGSYVRVWEREPGQDWKLALEVLNPRG